MSLLEKIKSLFSGGSSDSHAGHDHAHHDHDHAANEPAAPPADPAGMPTSDAAPSEEGQNRLD